MTVRNESLHLPVPDILSQQPRMTKRAAYVTIVLWQFVVCFLHCLGMLFLDEEFLILMWSTLSDFSFMVNVVVIVSRSIQSSGQPLLWVCLWECFWGIITFEFIEHKWIP